MLIPGIIPSLGFVRTSIAATRDFLIFFYWFLKEEKIGSSQKKKREGGEL